MVLGGSLLKNIPLLLLSLMYIDDLPDDLVYNVAISVDDTTLHYKFEYACDKN